MCITAQEVRDTSLTGEFDTLTDVQINKQIALVCPLYKTGLKRNFNGIRELIALHVAHNIYDRKKSEGADGDPGQVTSESFAQVGSRSYAVAPVASDGSNWWLTSPYGRDWKRLFDSLPPGLMALPTM